jgi:hypothetical protein
MPSNITSNDNYILIEFGMGMDYWEIIEGISTLFSMAEFKDKNDIWFFKDDHLRIMYSDLYSIRDMAKRLYPEEAKGKKTAIVAKTGVQQSLANLYSDLAKGLPREIKVFSDLTSAKEWINTVPEV